MLEMRPFVQNCCFHCQSFLVLPLKSFQASQFECELSVSHSPAFSLLNQGCTTGVPWGGKLLSMGLVITAAGGAVLVLLWIASCPLHQIWGLWLSQMAQMIDRAKRGQVTAALPTLVSRAMPTNCCPTTRGGLPSPQEDSLSRSGLWSPINWSALF